MGRCRNKCCVAQESMCMFDTHGGKAYNRSHARGNRNRCTTDGYVKMWPPSSLGAIGNSPRGCGLLPCVCVRERGAAARIFILPCVRARPRIFIAQQHRIFRRCNVMAARRRKLVDRVCLRSTASRPCLRRRRRQQQPAHQDCQWHPLTVFRREED